MTDLQPHEKQALDFAGQCAGEYLDEIGLTDLADMSEAQWNQFIEIVGVNFINKRIELDPNECPF